MTPGCSQYSAVVVSVRHLPQPRVHVTPYGQHLHVLAERLELGRAAGAAGADPGPRRKLFEGAGPPVYQHVPGVEPLAHGPYNQAVGQIRGQVFEAVHRHVQTAVEKGALDFLDENAPAKAGQGRLRGGIAAGPDDYPLEIYAGVSGPEPVQDLLRLAKGQAAAATTHKHRLGARAHYLFSTCRRGMASLISSLSSLRERPLPLAQRPREDWTSGVQGPPPTCRLSPGPPARG